MICPYCKILTVKSLSIGHHDCHCGRCNSVFYFFADKLTDVIFRYQDYDVHFVMKGALSNLTDVFYLCKYGNIILKLNFHPQITPHNIATKLPTILTFL
jgi:hypothetical protein